LVQPDAERVTLELAIKCLRDSYDAGSSGDDSDEDDDPDDHDDGLHENHSITFDFWLASVHTCGSRPIDGRSSLELPLRRRSDRVMIVFRCEGRWSTLIISCRIRRAHPLLNRIHTLRLVRMNGDVGTIVLGGVPAFVHLGSLRTVIFENYPDIGRPERALSREWLALHRDHIGQVMYIECAPGLESVRRGTAKRINHHGDLLSQQSTGLARPLHERVVDAQAISY
jgi:hypothetical protein